MNWNGTELKFQGRAALTEFMREHEDFLDYMEAKIRGIEVEMPRFEGVADEDGYVVEEVVPTEEAS